MRTFLLHGVCVLGLLGSAQAADTVAGSFARGNCWDGGRCAGFRTSYDPTQSEADRIEKIESAVLNAPNPHARAQAMSSLKGYVSGLEGERVRDFVRGPCDSNVETRSMLLACIEVMGTEGPSMDDWAFGRLIELTEDKDNDVVIPAILALGSVVKSVNYSSHALDQLMFFLEDKGDPGDKGAPIRLASLTALAGAYRDYLTGSQQDKIEAMADSDRNLGVQEMARRISSGRL